MLRDLIFLVLFFALIGVWLVGWVVLHLLGGLIHLLLIVAAIFLIAHLFRRRRTI
jgi:DMSO reductase anchor subunit